MDPHRAVWNARYERLLREGRTVGAEPWLDAWIHLVPDRGPRRALDAGSGAGHNARLLLDRGFDVTAIDISERALDVCRRAAPEARHRRADLRERLPFDDACFELVVADLSLHYFAWDTTVAAVAEVARVLVPGGVLAARFNSTGDVNYGAGAAATVGGDPRLLSVGGIEKRFFTEACVDRLFGPPWRVVIREEKTTHRFGKAKVLWEVVFTRARG
jgi:SAM-dependent methyltransferase